MSLNFSKPYCSGYLVAKTKSRMLKNPVNSEEELIHILQLLSWIFAGICSFLACVVSLRLINSHLASFTTPKIQRKIVGILWIVPIFAIDSWLSLRFIKASVYLDMFRDCYEAYVIHLFLSLMAFSSLFMPIYRKRAAYLSLFTLEILIDLRVFFSSSLNSDKGFCFNSATN